MLIIGIAGGTGSGKTTLVNRILEHFPKDSIGVIAQDAYYKENHHLSFEERVAVNYDSPDAIDFALLESHLKDLKSGKTIEMPVYSFHEHNRLPETDSLSPKKVILVEGILLFSVASLRAHFQLKVFVETDSEERLLRRLQRDLTERGRNWDEVVNRYRQHIKTMHEIYVKPGAQYADIILPANQDNSVGINVLTTYIKQYIYV